MGTTNAGPVAERKGSKIDLGARLVMTALYKRLFALGLWRHIRSVGGIREKGLGGAYFVTHDNRAFFEDLIRSGSFCRDTAAGSMLHRGVISLREVSAEPALHLELGDDERIYVHMDERSPVGGVKPDGTCRYVRAKTAEHIRKDVFRALTASRRAEGSPGRVSASTRELAAAETAFRRAREAEDPEALARTGVALGALLEGKGHLARAEELYRKAMATGHAEFAPAAAFSLGELLEGRGDLDGAEQVYLWLIGTGHPEFGVWATSSLAALLENRGDASSAREAYAAAVASGHPEIGPWAAVKLGGLLADLGDAADRVDLACRQHLGGMDLCHHRQRGRHQRDTDLRRLDHQPGKRREPLGAHLRHDSRPGPPRLPGGAVGGRDRHGAGRREAPRRLLRRSGRLRPDR